MRIDWNKYHVRLRQLGRSRWTRGLRVEPGWENDWTTDDLDLWFIWTGQGRLRLASGWTKVQAGQCLLLRPGCSYAARHDPNDPPGLNFIHFDLIDARGRTRPADEPLPPEIFDPTNPLLVDVMTRHIVETCFGFHDTGFSSPPYTEPAAAISAAMVESLLMHLDASTDEGAARPKKAIPSYERLIRQVAVRINENPQETPSIAELAKEFGYSFSHFGRIFKSVTGQTPELYTVHSRIRRAQRLLRETTLPVGEIATAVGYRDIYFFSRQFKQFVKQSPLQYRKSLAAD